MKTSTKNNKHGADILYIIFRSGVSYCRRMAGGLGGNVTFETFSRNLWQKFEEERDEDRVLARHGVGGGGGIYHKSSLY